MLQNNWQGDSFEILRRMYFILFYFIAEIAQFEMK